MTIVSKCSVLMSLLVMNITQILFLLIVKRGKTFRVYQGNVKNKISFRNNLANSVITTNAIYHFSRSRANVNCSDISFVF